MHRRVCVIGLGYIGLPTASFLATKGYDVLGVDIAPEVVATIGRAEIHIQEPDLDILVKSAVQSGRLKTALEPAPADIFVIAVPTPMLADKRADLRAVEAAVAAIAPHARPGNLVILEFDEPGRHHRAAGRRRPAGARRRRRQAPDRPLPGARAARPDHDRAGHTTTASSAASTQPLRRGRGRRSTAFRQRRGASSPTRRAPRWPS